MQTFSVTRFVAAIVVALGLSVAAAGRSAAQDDEKIGQAAAGKVRNLAFNQREQVLDDVASIMAGNEESGQSAELDVDVAAEGEVGESEDAVDEDEGEDAGVGGENCEPQGDEAVAGDAKGTQTAVSTHAVAWPSLSGPARL